MNIFIYLSINISEHDFEIQTEIVQYHYNITYLSAIKLSMYKNIKRFN